MFRKMDLLAGFALKLVGIFLGWRLGQRIVDVTEDVPCFRLGFLPEERPWDIENPLCIGRDVVEILPPPTFIRSPDQEASAERTR